MAPLELLHDGGIGAGQVAAALEHHGEDLVEVVRVGVQEALGDHRPEQLELAAIACHVG